jgi:hypothetical protein
VSYTLRPEDDLDQGDLVRRVVVCPKTPLEFGAPADLLLSNVCVLSHGCDIDKPRFDSVLVARVIRLSAIPDRSMAGNIRRNRMYEAFFLPAAGSITEDAYIDWRTIQAVDKQVHLAARQTDRYMASLDSATLDAASEGL